MVIIGVGNTGMLLATMFDNDPILLSTAHQDSSNFSNYKTYSFSEEGASKRFAFGSKIWENNIESLEKIFEETREEKIIIFSSLGGGSGSSSLNILSKILISNNNKILIVGIIPYKKEVNPPLSNAVLSINALMPLIPNVSVILFDNESLRKFYNNNWSHINEHIINKIDYLINLLNKYSVDGYSPLTLDQSELDSVVFGGGFVDFSDTFLEENNPKFEYGYLNKNTKNCLIAMYVDFSIKKDRLSIYHRRFTEVLDKISTRVSNARLIPGILRAKVINSNSIENKIEDRAYIIIASGLDIERYIKKFSRIKNAAVKKAIIYSEKHKGSKFIETGDNKILDI